MRSINGYGELRRQENTARTVSMTAGNLVANTSSKQGGISARMRQGEAWGFASSPLMDKEALTSVLKTASDNASFMRRYVSGANIGLESAPCSFHQSFRTTKPRLSDADKIDYIKALDDYIGATYPDLQNRTVSLRALDIQKTLATTDGSSADLFIPRVHIVFSMTRMQNGEPIGLQASAIGGLGEFEDYFHNPESLFPEADKLYQMLRQKCEGVRPEGGVKTCVLAPDLAGILAHEAVGHTVEYDLVRGGSIAAGLLNREVSAETVSIVDFAHHAFGEICPVPVFADDEGVAATDATLIEKGVLKGYMHSRQTAAECSVKATGNARAFAFSDPPLIRMRNTCILPGKDRMEDMIASVEDGYYFSHPQNGQADLTSEFMFGVGMGYEIKNGKLGRALLDTTVSGIAFDMLKTVTMVGDTVEWVSSGMCGKGQLMTVSMGGPAIVCRINVGGE